MTQGGHLREGQREVEALPQATEHDERTGREGACGHLTARALESAARGALAAKAAIGRVGAGAPVATDAWHAAASFSVQLAVFACRAARVRGPRPAHAPPTPSEAGASRPSPSASDWLSCLWARPQTICGGHRGPAHSLVAPPLTPPLQRLSPRNFSSLPALGFLRAGLSRSAYRTQLP